MAFGAVLQPGVARVAVFSRTVYSCIYIIATILYLLPITYIKYNILYISISTYSNTVLKHRPP